MDLIKDMHCCIYNIIWNIVYFLVQTHTHIVTVTFILIINLFFFFVFFFSFSSSKHKYKTVDDQSKPFIIIIIITITCNFFPINNELQEWNCIFTHAESTENFIHFSQKHSIIMPWEILRISAWTCWSLIWCFRMNANSWGIYAVDSGQREIFFW